jgi:hypothetical protein
VTAELAAFTAGRLSETCVYVEPSVQSKCASAVAGQSTGGATFTSFSLGYIAVKGQQALVGFLGTDCEPQAQPTCITNSDPAAKFTSGKDFDALYAAEVAGGASPVHAYDLIPCVQVGSKWYIYFPPGTF